MKSCPERPGLDRSEPGEYFTKTKEARVKPDVTIEYCTV
jgi:hypothetical protein